jgi:hypothetical protein
MQARPHKPIDGRASWSTQFRPLVFAPLPRLQYGPSPISQFAQPSKAQ